VLIIANCSFGTIRKLILKLVLHHGRPDLCGTPSNSFGVQGTVKILISFGWFSSFLGESARILSVPSASACGVGDVARNTATHSLCVPTARYSAENSRESETRVRLGDHVYEYVDSAPPTIAAETFLYASFYGDRAISRAVSPYVTRGHLADHWTAWQPSQVLFYAATSVNALK
jgi:hypothetical protein